MIYHHTCVQKIPCHSKFLMTWDVLFTIFVAWFTILGYAQTNLPTAAGGYELPVHFSSIHEGHVCANLEV